MTHLERLQHYKNALQLLMTGINTRPVSKELVLLNTHNPHWLMYNSGICELLKVSMDRFFNEQEAPELFPELYTYKPEKTHVFWWDKEDRKIRKNVLIDIIVRMSEKRQIIDTSGSLY